MSVQNRESNEKEITKLSSCILKFILFSSIFALSCSSKILKYEKVEQLKKNSEFESIVKIDSLGDAPTASIQAPPGPKAEATSVATPNNAPVAPASEVSGKGKVRKSRKGSERGATTTAKSKGKVPTKSGTAKIDTRSATPAPVPAPGGTAPVAEPETALVKHLPEVEDGAGFHGRRPIQDPFRVGESVVHEVSYLKMKAGEFEMKVAPPKMVNGRKSYSFVMSLRSASMFSSFYSVDDSAETLVDFEELIPRIFSLHVKESGQLREGQSYFDHASLRATHWEKKYTEKNGNEEKKQEWDILPYSQNVFSAIYYLRTFKWEIGKEYSFRIADDKENIMFRGKALRKERLSTPLGEFNTIVMKPEVSVKGIFKPMGDIFFWLSDDDRKYILRMELNIKIGTLVSEVIRIVPGQN